uniref:Gsp_56 putative toxin n=1 Tax=Gemmula speciosa TaxID=439592 RepID=A0A098LW54_GEMSP
MMMSMKILILITMVTPMPGAKGQETVAGVPKRCVNELTHYRTHHKDPIAYCEPNEICAGKRNNSIVAPDWVSPCTDRYNLLCHCGPDFHCPLSDSEFAFYGRRRGYGKVLCKPYREYEPCKNTTVLVIKIIDDHPIMQCRCKSYELRDGGERCKEIED